MLDLIVLLRASELYKQNCHNLLSGASFFADHAFMGDAYAMAGEEYDALVERVLGLGHNLDLVSVQIMAAEKLKSFPKDDYFSACLSLNKMILDSIEQICTSGKLSQGTLQLLGGFADDIEKENYKLGQRIK